MQWLQRGFGVISSRVSCSTAAAPCSAWPPRSWLIQTAGPMRKLLRSSHEAMAAELIYRLPSRKSPHVANFPHHSAHLRIRGPRLQLCTCPNGCVLKLTAPARVGFACLRYNDSEGSAQLHVVDCGEACCQPPGACHLANTSKTLDCLQLLRDVSCFCSS